MFVFQVPEEICSLEPTEECKNVTIRYETLIQDSVSHLSFVLLSCFVKQWVGHKMQDRFSTYLTLSNMVLITLFMQASIHYYQDVEGFTSGRACYHPPTFSNTSLLTLQSSKVVWEIPHCLMMVLSSRSKYPSHQWCLWWWPLKLMLIVENWNQTSAAMFRWEARGVWMTRSEQRLHQTLIFWSTLTWEKRGRSMKNMWWTNSRTSSRIETLRRSIQTSSDCSGTPRHHVSRNS